MAFNEETRIFEKQYRHWEIDLAEMQPLHSGVLLERIDVPESVILLTDRPPIHRGRVLRVGPGKRSDDGWLAPMEVQVGDVVRYQSADVDNGTHILINEADILFIERV